MTSLQHSTMQVATILENLETPGFQVDEMTFLAYGDDLLDFAIGLDSYNKNRWLLDCEPLPRAVYDGDAVCVGSGPSLDKHLDHLRRIQNRVLICAAHSVLRRLLDAGITPHVVTPKERLPDPPKLPEVMPESIIYAGLPVVQYAPERFHRHYLVGDSGRQAQWLGIHRQDIPIPTTSGSLSTSVAAVMATGRIWLVGHDMYIGHYAGFQFKEETGDGDILCADGQRRPANWVYRSCQNEIGRLAEGRTVIQTSEYGARIANAIHGPFAPVEGAAPVLTPRKTDMTRRPHPQLDRLGAICERIISVCESASRYQDMDLAHVCEERDQALALTLLQPIWVPYSIMRRTLNITDQQATDCMRESILNAFRALLPWARSVKP
jgi:hypothetical protein